MHRKLTLIISAFIFILSACEDDSGSYTQVKALELQIFQNIKEYREANGLSGPFVHQLLIVKEAQLYAQKMATGVEEVGTQGMDEHWEILAEYWDFYNKSGLVLETESSNADQVFQEILEMPGADTIILGDLSQCGVGASGSTTEMNYFAIFLAKAD